jgi:hypothetical protein
MELEIEYRRTGATPGLDKYYLHVKCFAVWECEIAHLTNGTISSNGDAAVDRTVRVEEKSSA